MIVSCLAGAMDLNDEDEDTSGSSDGEGDHDDVNGGRYLNALLEGDEGEEIRTVSSTVAEILKIESIYIPGKSGGNYDVANAKNLSVFAKAVHYLIYPFSFSLIPLSFIFFA